MESDGRTTIKGERKMKQMRFILFCCSLILWIGVISTETVVQANEGNGGQVITDGKISFYEGTTETSSSTSTEPSSATPSKPIGKPLPNTGEQIKHYSLIGGGLLLFVLIFLFFTKRRKGEQK